MKVNGQTLVTMSGVCGRELNVSYGLHPLSH